ncbi:MAG: hypothetical protein H7832_09205 [Magnetococcus sp. DMHC-6]
MKSLIAGMNYPNLPVLVESLSSFGSCDRVLNNHEALEAFDGQISIGESYDLMILEHVPYTESRQQLLQQIRNQEKRISVELEGETVIFLAIHLEQNPIPSEIFVHGSCTDFLILPTTDQQLLAKIRYFFYYRSLGIKREEKRRCLRAPLLALATLYFQDGYKIEGQIQQMSCNSFNFHPTGVYKVPAVDAFSLLKFHFTPFSSQEENTHAFPVRVVRTFAKSLILKSDSESAKNLSEAEIFLSRSIVSMLRSNNELESGWEILRFIDPLPDDVIPEFRKKVKQAIYSSPIVICRKEGHANGKYLYKVLPFRHVLEMQKKGAPS